tara:strand:- start:466 stop:753 length:288 start_codon:yes stop_codon:yes gene_type:complete
MYQKVRFTKESSIKKAGINSYNAQLPESAVTAALILDSDKLDGVSVTDVSQLFPYSESMKMIFLEISAKYDSFDDAFNADFVAKRVIRVNIDYSK